MIAPSKGNDSADPNDNNKSLAVKRDDNAVQDSRMHRRWTSRNLSLRKLSLDGTRRTVRINFVVNMLLLVALLYASVVWSKDVAYIRSSWTLVRTVVIFSVSWFMSFAMVEALDEIIHDIHAIFGTRDKFFTDTYKITVQLLLNASMSFLCIYLFFSPCVSCAKHYISEEVVSDQLLFRDNVDQRSLWKVLFGPTSGGVDDDPVNEVCRACLSWLVVIFARGSEGGSEGVASSLTTQNKAMDVVESRHDLVKWYNTFSKTESKEFLKKSWNRLLEGLADNGQFTDENLRDVLDDLLCSTASRVNSPDPLKFLTALDRPRFTGEDVEGGKGLQVPLDKLQAIMRGDMMHKLGPSACFMLRFTLFVPLDTESEDFPISLDLDVKSLLSETEMRAQECAFDVPGLVIAGLDPDRDLDSQNMLATQSAVDIYTRLPFEDEQHYFDTKEEYLAFFRWTVEDKIQSDWYFPAWLNGLTDNDGGNKNNDFALFLSEQQMYHPDTSSYDDPQSDDTLSSRSFYGTGQKFLTSLKLPGDTNYHYLHPAHPDSYSTVDHENFYRYINKPKKEDFLRMARSFWPDEFGTSGSCDATNSSSGVDGSCSENIVQIDIILQQLRSRIVEIDLAFFASVPGRKNQFDSAGAILYLDTETRMPMGIFKTGKTQLGQDIGTLFLPSEGRDWEHAKFIYRTVERAALASIHVIESHLGWSHAISLATMQTIPTNHKLYALLKPFTIGAHLVNNAAYHLLVREHSVLTHSSGLENPSDSLLYFGHHINFSESIPDLLYAKKLDQNLTKDMPLFSQGQRLWDVHYEWVETFVNEIIYDSDEAMVADDSLHRFWHHVNTFGRGHDPCVCNMDTDSFYKEGVWPQFDSTRRTCKDLLDSVSFRLELSTTNERRHGWCLQDNYLRINSLRNMLKQDCTENDKCNKLRHEFEHMRLDMGLAPLKTRKQLVDFLTTAIWHVTVGHRFNSDNMPSLTDPTFSGVRVREKDNNGEKPIMADVGTYVFGVTIGSLTTLKSNALLADWTPIYSYMSSLTPTSEERLNLFNKMDTNHRRYKSKLLKLSRDFLRESASRPKNQQSNVFNPASHSASVCV